MFLFFLSNLALKVVFSLSGPATFLTLGTGMVTPPTTTRQNWGPFSVGKYSCTSAFLTALDVIIDCLTMAYSVSRSRCLEESPYRTSGESNVKAGSICGADECGAQERSIASLTIPQSIRHIRIFRIQG